MTKMSGILFITPNYKNHHKLQDAGLWAKYRGNINLKDNFVTEEEENKDMFKNNNYIFFPQTYISTNKNAIQFWRATIQRLKSDKHLSTKGSGHKMDFVTGKSIHSFK